MTMTTLKATLPPRSLALLTQAVAQGSVTVLVVHRADAHGRRVRDGGEAHAAAMVLLAARLVTFRRDLLALGLDGPQHRTTYTPTAKGRELLAA